MALPTAYLTSTKNVAALFDAIQAAKAPPKFTVRFLQDLGFRSSSERLYINLLKALGFLSADGAPTPRYFEFLDQSQAGRILAEALEEAYADLFQLRRDAQKMDRAELRGKIKTLTQGQVSDAVVDKMTSTFLSLVKLADFNAPRGAGTGGGEANTGEGGTAGGGGGGDGDGAANRGEGAAGLQFTPSGSGRSSGLERRNSTRWICLQRRASPPRVARPRGLRGAIPRAQGPFALVSLPDGVYDFAFRAMLTEESLDHAGRPHDPLGLL